MSFPFPHSPVICMNVRERKPRQKKMNGEITVFYAVLRFKNCLILISKKNIICLTAQNMKFSIKDFFLK